MGLRKDLWSEEVRDRLSRALREHGITQRKLAAEIGVSEPAVSQWMTRQSEPDWMTLARICEVCKISADWLLGLAADRSIGARPEPARADDYHLPKVAFAAAGAPLHDLPPETAWYAFHRAWIERKAKGALSDDQRLVVVQVDKKHLGESMLPTIRPGAILVVDRGPAGRGVTDRADVHEGRVYLVNVPEGEERAGLTVKRIFFGDGALMLLSDNPDRDRYPPILVPLKGKTLQSVVVGRVIWIGQEEG